MLFGSWVLAARVDGVGNCARQRQNEQWQKRVFENWMKLCFRIPSSGDNRKNEGYREGVRVVI